MSPIEGQCEACGEPNPAGTQFCLFCGEYLGWTEATASTEDPPPSEGSSDTKAMLTAGEDPSSANAQVLERISAPAPDDSPKEAGHEPEPPAELEIHDRPDVL
ncbi:MAG: hypothetical protein WBG57_01470, partial [Ornithinimicrobium sp.]